MIKKKVLFLSNYCSAKTGFGGFMKEILSYLYRTGKYELCLVGAGMPYEGTPDFNRWPWKCYGTIPNDQAEIARMNQDPNYARLINYGHWAIDRAVNDFRPDVCVFSEDPWAFNDFEKKSFWNKIPCIVHTTLDSVPILDRAVELAKLTPYFYSWADFATQEMNKMGLTNVKTLRGTVNTLVYKKLPKPIKDDLRFQHGIPLDAFVCGMVFRNQLRKSVFALLEGYKIFKMGHPNVNIRLILATHWTEGWEIPKLVKEFGLDPNEILAVYKCRATQEYFILPYQGQDLNNPKTGQEKTLVTINVNDGITDEQLNEVYNLMDVYCHPFTSGGQERPIQEAKLCELVTLVTNYSCGEDCCVKEANSLPLEWESYREPGSQFVKAATRPSSIARQLSKFFKLDSKVKYEMGRAARQWVINNFGIDVVGEQFEDLLDSLPFTDWDFKVDDEGDHRQRNPHAQIPEEQNSKKFIQSLYKLILTCDGDEQGVNHWIGLLNQGMSRDQVIANFRKIAELDNAKIGKNQLDLVLGDEKPDDRICLVLPESLGDVLLSSALLKDARELYHDKVIYFATKPEFAEILNPCVGRYIDKIIPYTTDFDNVYALEGHGNNKKYFHNVIALHFGTQRMINYIRGGDDKSKINISYEQ